MGRVKPRTSNLDPENAIRKAKQDYLNGTYPSIHSAASAYGIPNSTLQGRLRGAQPTRIGHQKQQLLTASEEKAIVQFYLSLDNLGHPLKLSYVKSFAQALLPPSQRREVGKHWISRFLERNPSITSKFSQRLDRQRAHAEDPKTLKDFFQKV